MKRPFRWIVIAGALGSFFVVGFAAREMLFAQQQNHRPQNDKWGPNSAPLPPLSARQLPLPAMGPPSTVPPPHTIAPNPGGPIPATSQLRYEQWTPAPQSFAQSNVNPSYPAAYPPPIPAASPTTTHASSSVWPAYPPPIPAASPYVEYMPPSVQAFSGVYAQPGVSLPQSNIYLSPASHSKALATSRLLQEYATCDDDAKKEEILSQIKKHVTDEFEEKHAVTKRVLESLEKSAQKLREATEKREASKDKIIADRVASLVGRIDGTAWDFVFEAPANANPAIGNPSIPEFQISTSPAIWTTSGLTPPAHFQPTQMMFLGSVNHGWSQPNAYPGISSSPAYAPYPNTPPSFPTQPAPNSIRPGPQPIPTRSHGTTVPAPGYPPNASTYSTIPHPGTLPVPADSVPPDATTPGTTSPHSGPAALLPTIPSTPMPDEPTISPTKEPHSEETKPSEPSE